MTNPIECVGVICFRGDDVLLIRRGKPPRAGEWSIPGGRIEPGETQQDAALRELYEETGVRARLGQKIVCLKPVFDGKIYHLHDYVASWVKGSPRAGDDAMDAMFVSIAEIDTYNMWPKTLDVILQAHRTYKN